MMRILAALAASSLILQGCAAIDSINNNQAVQEASSWRLSQTAPNTYWDHGSSKDYNLYLIDITCEPVPALVRWNGKNIGTTPLSYKFSGVVADDECVYVTVIPYDESYAPQEAELKGAIELPREMRFSLIKNNEK